MSLLLENEELIVDQLRSKDKRAFSLVFNEYYGSMVLYACRFMDEREEAEEIVQDVFVKFWEKCASIAPGSSIKSYLYRAVHNSCLNAIKHEKVKDGYKQYIIHFLASSYQDDFELKHPEIVAQRIKEEVEALPPRCSEIFKLSKYDGLKYEEIAEYLGISIKTVEVQMGKALKILREKLASLKKVRYDV